MNTLSDKISPHAVDPVHLNYESLVPIHVGWHFLPLNSGLVKSSQNYLTSAMDENIEMLRSIAPDASEERIRGTHTPSDSQ